MVGPSLGLSVVRSVPLLCVWPNHSNEQYIQNFSRKTPSKLSLYKRRREYKIILIMFFYRCGRNSEAF